VCAAFADQVERRKREYLRAYMEGINITAAAAALITDLCTLDIAARGGGVNRKKKKIAPLSLECAVPGRGRSGKSFFICKGGDK
jgi:hypothetical protein